MTCSLAPREPHITRQERFETMPAVSPLQSVVFSFLSACGVPSLPVHREGMPTLNADPARWQCPPCFHALTESAEFLRGRFSEREGSPSSLTDRD